MKINELIDNEEFKKQKFKQSLKKTAFLEKLSKKI